MPQSSELYERWHGTGSQEPGLSPDASTAWLVILGDSLNLSDPVSSSVGQGQLYSLADITDLLYGCTGPMSVTALLS